MEIDSTALYEEIKKKYTEHTKDIDKNDNALYKNLNQQILGNDFIEVGQFLSIFQLCLHERGIIFFSTATDDKIDLIPTTSTNGFFLEPLDENTIYIMNQDDRHFVVGVNDNKNKEMYNIIKQKYQNIKTYQNALPAKKILLCDNIKDRDTISLIEAQNAAEKEELKAAEEKEETDLKEALQASLISKTDEDNRKAIKAEVAKKQKRLQAEAEERLQAEAAAKEQERLRVEAAAKEEERLRVEAEEERLRVEAAKTRKAARELRVKISDNEVEKAKEAISKRKTRKELVDVDLSLSVNEKNDLLNQIIKILKHKGLPEEDYNFLKIRNVIAFVNHKLKNSTYKLTKEDTEYIHTNDIGQLETYLHKVLANYINFITETTTISEKSPLKTILTELESLKTQNKLIGGKTLRLKNRTKKTRKNKKKH